MKSGGGGEDGCLGGGKVADLFRIGEGEREGRVACCPGSQSPLLQGSHFIFYFLGWKKMD